MLNLKSLITTLAIVGATGSVASAKPSVSFNASASWSYGTPAQPVVRDHRTVVADDDCVTPAPIAPVYQPVVYRQGARLWRPRPEPVLTIDNVKHTGATAEDYIGSIASINGRYGLTALTEPTKVDNSREDFYIMGQRLKTLQLRNTVGSTFVKQVTIEFMDDSAQVVQLNRTLSQTSGAITINVKNQDHRQIKRIFVYGQTAYNSAYQIFAA
jgi:hypothetical protein